MLACKKVIDRLDVPVSLHRNTQQIAEAGYEHTGERLIHLATRSVGLDSLEDVDVLDVGCGVRFTMSIINLRIPIRSYTGVDVSGPVADFLKSHVEAHDQRFEFAHWNIKNQRYNPEGSPLTKESGFPITGEFDLIWLFSVFTHLNPDDSLLMLQILRKKIRIGGKLFFSAFIDDKLDGFEDRIKAKPLLRAYYGKQYMQSLIEKAGWEIQAFHEKDPDHYIQHYIVCTPGKIE